MKKNIMILFSTLFVVACSDKEPAVTSVKRDKAIEVTFETQKLGDTAVLLLTRQNVYVKCKLVRSQIKRDTLPALGDSLQTVGEDEDQKTVRMPKEYEFFVTVK